MKRLPFTPTVGLQEDSFTVSSQTSDVQGFLLPVERRMLKGFGKVWDLEKQD